MKKMLVTGASGFLGNRICAYFSKEYEVMAPSHQEMELTSNESVRDYFEQEQPDIVIHCAAVSDVGKCEEAKEISYKINVIGTRNIAKACEKQKAKLIFCSSDQIYFGSGHEGAHLETTEVKPVNQYGRQKLEAEQECLNYCKDAVLLRLSWMYDCISKSESEHGDFFRNLMKAMVRQEKSSYPIHDYRGITYIRDVLENLEKTFCLPGGIYNYGAENEDNTYETVQKFIRKAGLEESLLEKNSEAFKERSRNIRMNTNKIKTYGIFLKSTQEGLEACIADSREKENK